MNWYVLYTKPKWELKVAAGLDELEIENYCPTQTEIRQWSDRKKKVTTPVFRSYVFVRLPDSDRGRVFQVPGAVRYLFWLQKPAIVRDEEIETIQKWLDHDELEEVNIEKYSPGDELTISKGSFKGRDAIVSKVGKKRLRLILKSLNCVIHVKLKDLAE